MAHTPDVAQIILEQLGGRRFVVMTGAKNLTSHPSGALSFHIPGGGGFAKAGINYIKIQLNAEDTYDVTFVRIRGAKYTVVAEKKGIYNDQLQEVFTRETGLQTSLGTLGTRFGIPATAERAFNNKHED